MGLLMQIASPSYDKYLPLNIKDVCNTDTKSFSASKNYSLWNQITQRGIKTSTTT